MGVPIHLPGISTEVTYDNMNPLTTIKNPLAYMTVVPMSGQVANIWETTKNMVLDGSKIHTQKIVKKMFWWIKDTYSKNDQRMVAGCPEGYAIDLKKWCLNSVSMAFGQPVTIFLQFVEYVFLTHPKPVFDNFLSMYV